MRSRRISLLRTRRWLSQYEFAESFLPHIAKKGVKGISALLEMHLEKSSGFLEMPPFVRASLISFECRFEPLVSIIGPDPTSQFVTTSIENREGQVGPVARDLRRESSSSEHTFGPAFLEDLVFFLAD